MISVEFESGGRIAKMNMEFNSIDNLLLAVVSYLVVDGKYFNKESRGTD